MIGINLVGKDTLNSPHFKTIDDAKNQRYLWVRGNVANLVWDFLRNCVPHLTASSLYKVPFQALFEFQTGLRNQNAV
jgi:hypothetical protein